MRDIVDGSILELGNKCAIRALIYIKAMKGKGD